MNIHYFLHILMLFIALCVYDSQYDILFGLQDVLGYLIKYEAAHTFVPKNTEKAKTLREIYVKDLGYVCALRIMNKNGIQNM